MQINTSAAILTALISSAIGFGLAFYLERKVTKRMESKSQRILTFIAMTSFGFGITASLNEMIGFPLQGLNVRYDKLAGYLIGNVIFLPIVLLAIAKLVGLKKTISNETNAAHNNNSNGMTGNFFKYLLMLAGAISIAYFGYSALQLNTSGAKFDLYSRVDYKNCNSAFTDTPITLKFNYKKETNEIFMTAEFVVDGIKKSQISTLDKCSILDSQNWSCGGEWNGSYRSTKITLVNGELSYDNGTPVLKDDANCPVKIIKH